MDPHGNTALPIPCVRGLRRFVRSITLPYLGSASLTATVLRPVGELALMVPDTIHFEARNPEMFQNRGRQSGSSVYFTEHVQGGKLLRFRLSAANRPVDLEIEAERSIQRFKSLPLSATAVPQTANPIEPILQASLFEWERHLLSFTALLAVCFCAGLMTIASFKKKVFQKRACERNGGGSSPRIVLADL